jgi:hypothetical protein
MLAFQTLETINRDPKVIYNKDKNNLSFEICKPLIRNVANILCSTDVQSNNIVGVALTTPRANLTMRFVVEQICEKKKNCVCEKLKLICPELLNLTTGFRRPIPLE